MSSLPPSAPPFFLIGRSPWLAVELDHLCGVENLIPAHGKWPYHVPGSVYMARHPRGSYVVYPLLSLEVAIRKSKQKKNTRLSHPYARESASRKVLLQEATHPRKQRLSGR